MDSLNWAEKEYWLGFLFLIKIKNMLTHFVCTCTTHGSWKEVLKSKEMVFKLEGYFNFKIIS